MIALRLLLALLAAAVAAVCAGAGVYRLMQERAYGEDGCDGY